MSLIDIYSSDIAELPFDESGMIDCVLAESAIDCVSGNGCFVITEKALSDSSIDFLKLKLDLVSMPLMCYDFSETCLSYD